MRQALAVLLGLLVLLGGGAAPALAEDYPLPTHGQGKVDKTRVVAGECVIFSGDGFKPGTPLTITDDGTEVATTTADANGEFSTQVCFSTTARLGRHVLMAEGIGANGAARDVTATTTVVGASSTRPPPGGSTGGSGTGTGTGTGGIGNGSGGVGNGTGTGNGTGGNGTGGNGTGTGNGTGGNGQPSPTPAPGAIGTGGETTTGGTGPAQTTTGGDVAIGPGSGIGKLALYGGLAGLVVLLLVLYLLWRDKRDRDGQLPGLAA